MKILITGVSRGFGRAVAQEALKRNAQVYGVSRNENACSDLVEKGMKFISADLDSDQAIESIQKSLRNEKLDVLVSNAGIPGTAMTLEDLTSHELLKVLNTHVLGAMRVTKGCLNNLKQSGMPRIIFVSSRLGSTSLQFEKSFSHLQTSYSYRIAKAALNMLAASISVESPNIHVMAIHPGRLKTESGHTDANLDPEIAAERLFALIESPNRSAQILNLDGESFPF